MTDATDFQRYESYVRIARLAARRNRTALVAALTELDDPPDRIVETLGRHTLIGLVLKTLDEGDDAALPAGLAARLREWRAKRWISVEALVETHGQVFAALAARGVPVLSLKGLYFADRLYGGIDRRPMQDIDLLVPRRQLRRAVHALASIGFRADSHDAHSRTVVRNGIKIDLHHCLRRAPAFRIDEEEFWASSVDAIAGPLRVRTLSDEWALVFLLLAAFEDLGQGLIKLRQLMDLALLVGSLDATFDWDSFFERRRPQSLLGVAVNVLDALIHVFDAAGDWPRLMRAIQPHRSLVVEPQREAVLALVFAPRKHPSNLAWFARVYPGSLGLYLAWFWYGGFPQNLSQFSWSRLASSLQLAFRVNPKTPAARSR